MRTAKEATSVLTERACGVRDFVLPVIAFCLLSTTQCSRRAGNNPGPATAKCISRLKSIPELSAIKMENGEFVGAAPSSLEGVQMALTITGSIQSVADPNIDADDVCYKQNSIENLDKLIKALKDNGLPPTVDFVNGRDFDAKVIDTWLKSGNLIGNMTSDPLTAVQLTEDQFVEAVSKMDRVLQPFWAQYPESQKYFRYVHLNPSRKQDIREREEALIARENYRIVPATVTGYDQQFAWLYCAAQARGDQACLDKIKESFFPLLLDSIQRARTLSRELSGNLESKQILELRANQFTIDMIDDWIKRLKGLGVKFIPLDQALSDPLYSMTSKKGMPVAAVLVKRIARQQQQGSQQSSADANN